MKRFFSHLLFIPGIGYIKKCIIEVNEKKVSKIIAFEKESESIVWYPGLLILLPMQETTCKDKKITDLLNKPDLLISENLNYTELYFHRYSGSIISLVGCYPYNFTQRLPLDTTHYEVLI